jgi:kinetochore protein Mis12/MTW1
MTTPITRPVSSILLQEILGFAPELLLDDIVDSANNSIYQCVNAMEPFLRRWVEQRSAPLEPPPDEPDWSPEAEIEQGLVAFQTLLENHVDIAFDFFDVWCRRNVFTFNPDLPIVVPHQQELDLSLEPERETELLTDIEELRRAIDNVRFLSQLKSLSTKNVTATQSASVLASRKTCSGGCNKSLEEAVGNIELSATFTGQ